MNQTTTGTYRKHDSLAEAAEAQGFILDTLRSGAVVAVCTATAAMFELRELIGDDLAAFMHGAVVALSLVRWHTYTGFCLVELRTHVNGLCSTNPRDMPEERAEELVFQAFTLGFRLTTDVSCQVRAIAARLHKGRAFYDFLSLAVAVTDLGVGRKFRGDLPATKAERPAEINPRLRVQAISNLSPGNSARFHVPRGNELAILINHESLAPAP